tara:strand:+ start:2239 stop:3921 length:1683 start_codon:yes stop_codon:yes gene_type:complete
MITDKLVGAVKGAALQIDLTHPLDPALARSFAIPRGNIAGVPVNEDSALGLASFWRGCNIISNGVAKPPATIKIRTDKGSQDDTDHPHFSLVNSQANPFNSACDLRRILQLHALLWGNGVAMLNRVGSVAVEAIPLLPDRTGMAVVTNNGNKVVNGGSIDRSQKGLSIKYVTNVGSDPKVLDPADVIHIRGLSYNGLWGFPVVELLADTIGSAIAPRDYGARMFSQGALSSGILFMPPGLSEEQQERFVQAVQTGSTGLGKAHRWMVLEEGADFKPLNLPAEHAQMLATMEHKTKDLANIIGIQPHKLGDTARKSYNSLEQSNQEHLDDDLDPWLQKWEEELGLKLLSREERTSGSHFVEMDRKSLQRTNLAAMTSHVAAWRQWGIYSANDGRALQGLNDIGPQGDVYMVPSNMVPAKALSGEVTLAAPAAAPVPAKEPEAESLPEESPEIEEESESASMRERKVRLCRNLSAQAEKHSRKGGAKFCEWLDRMAVKQAVMCSREDPEPELTDIFDKYLAAMDEITRPPHSCEDLFMNQAVVAKRLETELTGEPNREVQKH